MEILSLIELVDKETREAEPYNMCTILSKVILKANNNNEVYAKATKIIKDLQSLFKTTDWLRELYTP